MAAQALVLVPVPELQALKVKEYNLQASQLVAILGHQILNWKVEPLHRKPVVLELALVKNRQQEQEELVMEAEPGASLLPEPAVRRRHWRLLALPFCGKFRLPFHRLL